MPNTPLNVLLDRLQANRLIPLGPGHCRVTFADFYPACVPQLADRNARDHALSDLVHCRDIDICEAMQRALESGSYTAKHLNPKRENGVHQFHELLRDAYRSFP